MKREFQINFLKRFGLMPQHYLLDIGCGTLRGGIPLIDYLDQGHYFGIEVRNDALEEGRKELKESGLEWKSPKLLLVPDMAQAHLPQKFDFIWAFSVLFHMADDVLNGALSFVSRHLAAGGVFFANIRTAEKEDRKWKGLDAVWRSLEFYQRACANHGLILSDLGPLKNYGHAPHATDPNSRRMLRITLLRQ